MDRENSPAYSVLRPGSRRLLAFIATMVEHDGGGETTIWHDQLADVVGSKSIISSGLRELIALGFIVREVGIKQSTFTLSDGWKNAAKATGFQAEAHPSH